MREARERIVNGSIAELESMETALKEKLYTVKTIEETLSIAEELTDVREAKQDAIIHKEHFVSYGFIYC